MFDTKYLINIDNEEFDVINVGCAGGTQLAFEKKCSLTDELSGKFYMLADEDKADVIKNKEKYTLEEIEAKLSVICFRKKVNFDLETNDKNENNTEDDVEITTYNLSDNECLMPAWIKEALARQNKTE